MRRGAHLDHLSKSNRTNPNTWQVVRFAHKADWRARKRADRPTTPPKLPAIADDPPPPLGREKENPSTPPLERGQSRPPCRQAGPPTKTRTNRPQRVRKRPRRCLSRARVRAGREPL